MDFHVNLEGRGDLTARIYRAVLDGIRDGRLRPGDRLPTTRDLARIAQPSEPLPPSRRASATLGTRVVQLTCGADDGAVLSAVQAADRAAVDCPLGWPEPFVHFLLAHRAGRTCCGARRGSVLPPLRPQLRSPSLRTARARFSSHQPNSRCHI